MRSLYVRRELRVEPLIPHVEKSQPRWFGFLIRMPSEQLSWEVSNWDETPGLDPVLAGMTAYLSSFEGGVLHFGYSMVTWQLYKKAF